MLSLKSYYSEIFLDVTNRLSKLHHPYQIPTIKTK